jgi:hypothetical protein
MKMTFMKTLRAVKLGEFLLPISSKSCVMIKIYKTIFFPAVLYDCATLSLTLREEQRMRVPEENIWAQQLMM